MAKLTFRYGAMGASKTANALMVRYNYLERGKNPVMLKPRLENRDGKTAIRSRIGLEAECEYVEDFLEKMKNYKNSGEWYDAIIVDEAQFLTVEQVDAFAAIVDDYNIPVICYGLRKDFKTEGFEGSTSLLLIADKIEEIKNNCWCGKSACFNERSTADCEVVRDGDKIVFGANDTYISLCRKHYKTGRTSKLDVEKEMRY